MSKLEFYLFNSLFDVNVILFSVVCSVWWWYSTYYSYGLWIEAQLYFFVYQTLPPSPSSQIASS